MNNKETYSQLLKDPRWQKRRLEIMQRDNFTCQICGHNDKPLHVHHVCYDKKLKPWEYNDGQLITLCEDCHKEEHESYSNIIDWIRYLRERGILMIEIESIFSIIEICVGGLKQPDAILRIVGGPNEESEEKQDWWGLDSPGDICERIAKWREKTLE